MVLCTDLKDMIRFGDKYAEMEMPFCGSATNGMLLWLDEHLLKEWCKLGDVKVEPEQGGMFYLRWSDNEEKSGHAVYGILDEIDTEAGSFRVKKIIWIKDTTKLQGLELHVSFISYPGNDSAIKLRLSHLFDPRTKFVFDRYILMLWPKTFNLFRKFAENR